MKTVALILGLVGAVMLAANLNLNAIAYLIMLASAIIWIAKLWRTEREATILQAGFALINVIGIWSYI